MGTDESPENPKIGKAYLTPLKSMRTPSPLGPALAGMPNVADLGMYATADSGAVTHVAPHLAGVVITSESDRCYGLGVLANLALTIAYEVGLDYTTLLVHPPTALFEAFAKRTDLSALGSLIGNRSAGLHAAPDEGVVHVSRALIVDIGYPDPSLPDSEVFVDYGMRAYEIGFYDAVCPPPRPEHRTLAARYGSIEAAYRAWTKRGGPLGARSYIGPILGRESALMLCAGIRGNAPYDWFVDSPDAKRLAALIRQANNLTVV